MSNTIVLTMLAGVAYMAITGAILFGCAGRWDLPMFWALEDRVLHEQLDGYPEYAERVRYRVFPGIW